MKVLTLFLRHGTTAYPGSAEALAALFAALAPAVEHRLVTIDNALASPGPDGPDGAWPGDNRAWEFAGWDAARRRLGDEVRGHDLVHLATSAWRELGPDFWTATNAQALGAVRGRPTLLGHVDCVPEPIRVGPFRLRHWVRSSWIFLSPRSLGALGAVTSHADPDAFFGTDPARPFRDAAPLCPGARRLLLEWLTGPGLGQGTSWHSRFALGPESMDRFRMKGLAVLNELTLPARLRALGVEPVDLLWLEGQAAAGRIPDRPESVPWRAQLSGRARHVRDPGP